MHSSPKSIASVRLTVIKRGTHLWKKKTHTRTHKAVNRVGPRNISKNHQHHLHKTAFHKQISMDAQISSLYRGRLRGKLNLLGSVPTQAHTTLPTVLASIKCGVKEFGML